MSQQLPFHFMLRDDARFDNFYQPHHFPLIQLLKNFIDHNSESFIYGYGEIGVGKTHLLQACCHMATEQQQVVFYIPLSCPTEFSFHILDALEKQEIILIDDIDAVIGDRAWEEALFHLYNRAQEHKTRLLLSGQLPPKQLKCVLPDLQSRLCSVLVLEIPRLSDVDKTKALQLRANSRGFTLSTEVAHFLLHRYTRNMHDLFQMLEKLDYVSLSEKRKITIPFVKSVLS